MVPTRKDDENVRVRAYNDAMPALVKARADAGKHVILVDNDLHPADAGYATMAKTWWHAIGSILPAAN